MKAKYKKVVLVSGIASFLAYIIKKQTGYQLESEFANELVNYICYVIWGLVIADNSKVKHKIRNSLNNRRKSSSD